MPCVEHSACECLEMLEHVYLRNNLLYLGPLHQILEYAKEEDKVFKGFSPEVEVILRSYDWPGNVRQLQNVIRNIVVLHDGDLVEITQLPPPLNITNNNNEVLLSTHQNNIANNNQEIPKRGTVVPLANVERNAIVHAINLCEGNIPKAAALLEVSPSTIYRKKQNWEET